MAIQSLFGASPEEVILARQKEARQEQLLRNQQIAQQGSQFGVFAPLYQAGLRFGDIAGQAITQGLFPSTGDPLLKKATDIQSVLSKYQGRDLTNSDILKSISGELASLGYANEAMMLSNEAAKYSEQEFGRGLRERQLAVSEADIQLKQQQAAEAKETNLVTTNGDPIVKKEGKFFVQTTDDEGNIKLNPYSKKTYGPIETKSDYARAQAGAGGGIKNQVVYGAGGLPIGYDILDKQGNLIRRELFRGGTGTTAGAGQPTPAAPVPNVFRQALEERLKNQNK
jgi:hypothetical protein